MMFKTTRWIVAALVVVCLPLVAAAQAPKGVNDPDMKELLAYKLTMATVNKVGVAMKNLAVAMKNDPRFQKQMALKTEIKKLEEKEELTEAEETRLEKLRQDLEAAEDSTDAMMGNAQTLSQMAAAINKEPAFAKALASAGLDAREYSKFMLAYMQAGIVAGFMKSGVIKEVPKDLAATVNMENVKFIQEHEAELEAFIKSMEALKMP